MEALCSGMEVKLHFQTGLVENVPKTQALSENNIPRSLIAQRHKLDDI